MSKYINRREFLKLASNAAGAAALTACQGRLPFQSIHVQDTLPNILFILTDDMDTSSLAYMPYVRQHLENQGVYMTNYFINLPLCCPSRATNLTGQYAHNSSIKNSPNNRNFHLEFLDRVGRFCGKKKKSVQLAPSARKISELET